MKRGSGTLVRGLLVAMGVLYGAGAAWAAADPPAVPTSGEDEKELESLLKIAAEETAIVTQSRMNADFVPGIVTVLHGDELEALGARTVLEALTFVPGIQTARDLSGLPVLQVRGIDTTFNNGGVRVLVDSRTLSREDAGLGGSTLLMPLSRVERIEVIRGPGSVWGDFAFMGLVNIVTRKETTGGFVGGGSGELEMGGLSIGSRLLEGPVSLSASVAGWRSVGADLAAGVTGREIRGFGDARLSWGGFSLATSLIRRNLAKPTGLLIPGLIAGVVEMSETVEARYAWNVAPERRIEWHAGYLDNEISDPATSYAGYRVDTGVDASWRLGRHRLLLQGSWATSRIRTASHQPPPPAPRFTLRDVDGDESAATLQDEVDLSSRLTVTAGLRWDEREHVGSRVTPRVAAVFRLSETHTLKAQWAEGFRAPTFFQLYGGGFLRDLGFESIQTVEFGYVYRCPSAVARATFFQSRLSDLLATVRVGPAIQIGTAEAKATGVELEYSQSLGELVKVLANVSLVDTDDSRDASAGETADSFGEAAWLWNLGTLVRLTSGVTAGLHWSHVGRRAGRPGTAETFDGTDLVNGTITWRLTRIPGATLRAGVRNVFDVAEVQPYRLPDRVLVPDYGRRAITVQGSYGF